MQLQRLQGPSRGLRAHTGKAPIHVAQRIVSFTQRTQTASRVAYVATRAAAVAADGLVTRIADFCKNNSQIQTQAEAKLVRSDMGERVGLVAKGNIAAGQTIISIPESLAITQIDAEKQELVGGIAGSCSELIALTLWMMAERAKGSASSYASLLAMLPESVPTSPLLWSDADLKTLLTGSPVLGEARNRITELKKQWAALAAEHFTDASKYPAGVFNEQNFMNCFTVVVAHASFLPSAGCFALLPLTSTMARTGNEGLGCTLDYNTDTQTVEVKTTTTFKAGQEIKLFDGRPNGELLLSTGSLEESNASNFILFDASLVQADRYYTMKAQILESLGFGPKETFPAYADRMPIQLFSYLRLARVSDPALFAKVSFDKDVQLSQMNEYEILQILMGDCRERIAAYPNSYEEDLKLLQGRELNAKERVAAKLRLSEIKLLNSSMDAVRQRLAPIRGIPTKSGAMADPNQDLKEIFDAIESIPSAPKKLLDGFMSWARGDDDPDWKKPAGGAKRK